MARIKGDVSCFEGFFVEGTCKVGIRMVKYAYNKKEPLLVTTTLLGTD